MNVTYVWILTRQDRYDVEEIVGVFETAEAAQKNVEEDEKKTLDWHLQYDGSYTNSTLSPNGTFYYIARYQVNV